MSERSVRTMATTRQEVLADDLRRQDTAPDLHEAPAWRRVACMARNAFREAVRDRVLYNLVLFVLLLTVGAVFLGEVSYSQDAKIIVDLGLSAMLLFGTFIAIFVGVTLVYKEIDRRTVFAIFAKPVARGEFLLGKYLGLCLTLAVNVLVMGAGVSLALVYVKGAGNPLVWQIWPAVALIYAELALVTAIALLFSSFSTPVLSALASFGLFVIGHFSAELKTFADALGAESARLFFAGLFYALPNLSTFGFITAAAHGVMPPATYVLTACLYALVYIAVLLGAATFIFGRRDFK